MENISFLICPKDHSKLIINDQTLICSKGHEYPIIEGIPVLLNDSSPDQTMSLVKYSLLRAKGEIIDKRCPDLYLETLGIGEKEKEIAINLYNNKNNKIDPIVSVIIGATSGNLYQDRIGKLSTYPIPELRLHNGEGKLFLDIGCNWGRWSISAARKGYKVIAIDPSLGAVIAAKRVSTELGLSIDYICGDGRYLPFEDDLFDVVFSYSVIQHLSKDNAKKTLFELKRTLKKDGYSFIQMPNKYGVRSLWHQMKRKFREPTNFEVRYWSPSELLNTFRQIIGPSSVSIDGFLGLGIQKSDAHLLSIKARTIIYTSEVLRKISVLIKPLKLIADSLYIKSFKNY